MLPLFDSVLIQTNAHCNLRCKFCFYGQYSDYDTDATLPTDHVADLLDQLAGLGYRGRLALYNMNEPTTDPRIVSLLALARRRLPEAFHFLSTNGLLLTQSLLDDIVALVDHLRIDQYGKLPELDYSSPAVEIQDRRKFYHTAASNRGGALSRLPAVTRAGVGPCANPYAQLVVMPPGRAVLCCSDGFASVIVGDTTRTPLVDIWAGDTLERIRYALANGGRASLPLCKDCSVEGGGFREYFETPEPYRRRIAPYIDAAAAPGGRSNL